MKGKHLMAAALSASLVIGTAYYSCDRHDKASAPQPPAASSSANQIAPGAPINSAAKVDDETASKLKKHFSKYGPWISRLMDFDYSDGKKTGVIIAISQVPIARLVNEADRKNPTELVKVSEEISSFFEPKTETITLRNAWEDVVDHEIAHAFSSRADSFWIRLDGYSGPSVSEIERMSKKRADRMKRYGAFPQMMAIVGTLISSVKKMIPFEEAVIRFDNYSRLIGEKQEKPDDEKVKHMRSEADLLRKMVLPKLAVLQEVKKSYFEVKGEYRKTDPMVSNRKTVCPSDLKNVMAMLARLDRSVAGLEAVREALDRIEAFNRKAGGEFFVESGKGGLRGELADMESMRSKHEFSISLISSKVEVFAQMFDSLMGLYVGEDCLQVYDLVREEIDFFAAMKHDGAPMLGKAVEKYRIARRMHSEGMDPKSVKDALEYAEAFRYKEKDYRWQPHDIGIKGAVSRISSLDDILRLRYPSMMPRLGSNVF